MSKKAEDIMTRQLISVKVTATLKECHDTMRTRAIRHLLIIEDGSGKLLGLISDRDVKKFISPFAMAGSATDRDKATLAIEVGKVMVKSVITAKPGDKLSSVIDTMMQKKFSAIPIVEDGGKAVGIITSTDTMKLLMTML